MSFLRLYSPELSTEQKRLIARSLTDGIIRSLHLPVQAQAEITIQFLPFRLEDVAVGGELLSDSGPANYLLEIADRGLTREKKDALNRDLTPLLGRLLDLEMDQWGKVYLVFRNYEPHDIAVGGRFFDEIGH
jgi:phenylpyruvate tautomerase PptA (4-oxalocrotonate tautomerase family)